ncbi:MAG: Tetratricopeptide 2 repeat protein [Myxococcales bacterium]|nr:Tetratricopeptide 2 repeat protein [Myxococcales bacterium]
MRQRIPFVCAALLAPALAFAQPKTADEYYKEGETQYNLGNFPQAVEAFKKGFEVEPNESKKAAYLYNVAQAYRQNKDCSNAQFFYKRYLALKEDDTKKPLKPEKKLEIEERLKELDECARQQEAIRNKPPGDLPDGEEKPETPAEPTQVAVVPDDDPEDGITKTAPGGAPRVISARLVGGGAKVSAGDLPIPTLATAALLAGYPIAVGDKLIIEVGAGFTYTRVPYEQSSTMEQRTANLIGLVANVGASYEVIPKLSLRGDLGAGGLFFTGASESPFTQDQPTSGTLTMPHVRVGLSADYAITPNVLATVTPIAFSYSPPKEGLRDDIKSITAIDFMVGVGYRM